MKSKQSLKRRAALIASVFVAVGAAVYFALPYLRTPAGEPGGAPVARRITAEQYRQSISDIFGVDIKLGGRFEPDIRAERSLVAVGSSESSVSGAGLEQFNIMAVTIASQVVDERHRDMLVPCAPADPAQFDAACARQFLSGTGRLLYRRPLRDDELADTIAVAQAAATKLGNFYSGLEFGLARQLVSPEFLFIIDEIEADPAAPGKLRLTPYSMATRLSFLFWNTTPDDALLTAAEKGELRDRDGLARQVDRLMASPRFEAGVRAFFRDMLAYEKFDTLAKDPIIYPAFTVEASRDAAEQMLRTVVDHLLVRDRDYRDLFTTRDTFLTASLAPLYGVPMAQGGWMPYTVPADDERGAGMLTMPAFLAMHSHAGRTSPTLRGKNLRELLLCQKVPDPPGNVDFSKLDETDKPDMATARARLSAHAKDDACVSCHKITDPIGLAMENFDSDGHFRKLENGRAIDASGSLDGVEFTSPAKLGAAMRDNPGTVSCLYERAYAYAAARAPNAYERSWLRNQQQRMAWGGYHFPEILRRIATSDVLYAIKTPAADKAQQVSQR